MTTITRQRVPLGPKPPLGCEPSQSRTRSCLYCDRPLPAILRADARFCNTTEKAAFHRAAPVVLARMVRG